MKLTRDKLKQIIKEELKYLMTEADSNITVGVLKNMLTKGMSNATDEQMKSGLSDILRQLDIVINTQKKQPNDPLYIKRDGSTFQFHYSDPDVKGYPSVAFSMPSNLFNAVFNPN